MSKNFKKIVKFILTKISRIIYWTIPKEYKLTPEEYKRKFKTKLELQLEDNLVNETFKNFGKYFKKSVLFKDVWKIREYAIQTSLLNDKNKEYYYLEFGVWKGESANFFSNYAKKLYVFDSFQGLSEDWPGTGVPKHTYSLNKQIPKLNSNVEPVVGWVEDTLDDFLKKNNPKINFVNLDMDIYTPTKYTLEKLKPYLVKDAIIIFDELYRHIGWEEGEYKALIEVFKEKELHFKAFHLTGTQSVIQIK